jgi:uncharacterized phage-associated protein
MEKLAFCEYCMDENEYKIHHVKKKSILNGEELCYISKEAICNNCSNEIFVSNICDDNLRSIYEEYRISHNIIKVIILKRIINNYSINEEALSLLLSWNRNTIRRYLDGDMIVNSHSDILKNIYEDINYYSIILQTNKERIEAIDYSKSRQAVKDILSMSTIEEKIDAVIKYLLIRCEDLTPHALQKILYYVQGFYYVFTDNFIFKEDCQASTKGPLYSNVYERYERFGYEEVNKDILNNDKFKLEDVERNIVESVIKFYSCYSGKILEQMTRNEAPWMLTMTNIINENNKKNENINRIIEKKLITEYFKGIKEKYNMINLLDIQKYSKDLFDKISM